MFGEIVGHRRAKALLSAAIRRNRPGHAYLFLGPDRVGKVALARVFARTLNCTALLDERACSACDSCRRFATDSHPDFRLVTRGEASERKGRAPKNIPIESVRAIQHDASLSSHLGGYKVYVIDGAEDLSLPAMDALLKTLEEPASRVVLILTSIDAGALPQTIVSRCQVVKLGPVASDEIAQHLVAGMGASDALAGDIAHLADGRPGWAIEAAGIPELLQERDQRLGALTELDQSSRVGRLKVAEGFAQEHAKGPELTSERLELLAIWWRDVMMVRAGCDELVVNRHRLDELRGRAARLGIAESRRAIAAIEAARQQLAENVQPRLALELLALSLPATA